jgi:hypothetical protein
MSIKRKGYGALYQFLLTKDEVAALILLIAHRNTKVLQRPSIISCCITREQRMLEVNMSHSDNK